MVFIYFVLVFGGIDDFFKLSIFFFFTVYFCIFYFPIFW